MVSHGSSRRRPSGLLEPPHTATVLGGLLLTIACPTAVTAAFSCFEWPSVIDPTEDVHYLTSDACDADLAALSRVDGFQFMAEANKTEFGCSNSVGMIFFGDLCNETTATLADIYPGSSVVQGVICDGGYLATSNTTCPALADLFARVIAKVKGPDRDEPVDMPEEAEADPLSGFFNNRTPQWYAVFASGCVAALFAITLLATLAVRGFKRHSVERKAGGFHAGSRRQVKVKQGVYSGVDELGFTADEIKIMDPGETKSSSRKTRGMSLSTPPSSVQASPLVGPGSNVRYHHPDWCASSPSSSPHNSPKAKRALKPTALASGYESDQALLLY